MLWDTDTSTPRFVRFSLFVVFASKMGFGLVLKEQDFIDLGSELLINQNTPTSQKRESRQY